MTNEKMVVSFKTTQVVNELSEMVAKKNGQTKSEFLSMNAIDTAMNFEYVRILDVLSEFLDLLLPRLVSQGLEKETVVATMATLQRNYVEQRLKTKMRLQKHLTDVAIRSYLQGYTEQMDNEDGFIVMQCLQTIYDNLLTYDLISEQEFKEKTKQYESYMQNEGSHYYDRGAIHYE